MPRTMAFGSLVLATALVTSVTPAGFAQDAPVGTIVIAHGGSPAWNALVRDAAMGARTDGPVHVSFLMGPEASTHRFQDAALRLVDRGVGAIVVVPVLVSSHSGHFEQIRYLVGASDSLSDTMRHHLHMAGIERPDVDVSIVLAPAIDGDPAIVPVLAERALALVTEPARQALFIIGHGPSTPDEYAIWMRQVRNLADSVQAATGFADVRAGLLWDDSPPPVRAEAVLRIRDLIALQHRATGRPVVVVPLLISRGRVSDEKIPADLAGLEIAYSGEGLLPHAAMSRWIEKRVMEVLKQ